MLKVTVLFCFEENAVGFVLHYLRMMTENHIGVDRLCILLSLLVSFSCLSVWLVRPLLYSKHSISTSCFLFEGFKSPCQLLSPLPSSYCVNGLLPARLSAQITEFGTVLRTATFAFQPPLWFCFLKKEKQIQGDGLFLNGWVSLLPWSQCWSQTCQCLVRAQLNAVIPMQFEIKVRALSLSILDFLCRNPADSFLCLGFSPRHDWPLPAWLPLFLSCKIPKAPRLWRKKTVDKASNLLLMDSLENRGGAGWGRDAKRKVRWEGGLEPCRLDLTW